MNELNDNDATMYVIDMRSEANLVPFGEPNTDLRHDKLNDRHIPEQHPIESITYLREELDEINRLKTVPSDKRRCADYYLWKDRNIDLENRIGKFVTVCQDLYTIDICNEDDDILGVIVDGAGFIGNYDENGRDETYGLVATMGVVDVRCESRVQVGDCVASNDHGIAKTVNSKYGYTVIALKNANDVPYATISLGSPISQVPRISKDVSDMDKRVKSAEQNATTALNVAYDTNDKINKIHEAIANASNKNDDSMADMSDIVDAALGDAAEAKKVVEQLKADIEKSTTETLNAVEDALEGVEKLTNDLTPIMTFTDEDGNVGPVYMARYLKEEAATKQEVFALDSKTNEKLSSFQQTAEGFEMMASCVDKYSIGEFSMSCGLTAQQATEIIKQEAIYIPVVSHTEEYNGGEIYFQKDYYYVWNTDHWEEHNYPTVIFSPTVPGGVIGQFWYLDSNTAPVGYEEKTLYQFNNNKWNKIAVLNGNANNRTTSLLQQSAHEIKMSVSDTKNSVAQLDARITGAEASISTVAKWSKGGRDDGHTIAAIDQSANQDGSTLTLMVANEDGVKEISGASIVLGAGDHSYIAIDADNISFTGHNFNFATKQIIDGSVNLARNDIIKHTIDGCENTSSTPYPWQMTKESPDVGSYIDQSIFEIGETYTLSYIFKKTEGTLVNIGGDASGVTEISLYIDEELQSGYVDTVSMTDDMNEHYVVFTFTYDSDCPVYIQPNKGEYVPITYELWNIKLEKGTNATEWSVAPEDVVGSNDIITRINASAEGVTIQGEKIDLIGNTTFSSLTTEVDGKTVINGGMIDASTLTLSADSINSGTYRQAINVADHFVVDTSGNITLDGNITWGTGSSPTQVLYCSTSDTKPTDGLLWSSFPLDSEDGWHQTFKSGSDYYGSYTYDGGQIWGDPIQIVGVDGNDADVTYENVFNALTDNGQTRGCFTGINNELYINADYIKTGQIDSDLVLAGKVDAYDIRSTGGTIGGWCIDSDSILSNRYVRDGEFVSGRTITGMMSNTETKEVEVDGNTATVGTTMPSLVTGKMSQVRFIAGATPAYSKPTATSDGHIELAERAPFSVLEDGTLYATAAMIKGQIYATDGEFTGTITGSIFKSDDGTSVYLGTSDLTGQAIGGHNSLDLRLKVGSNFGVTKDGFLYANKGVFGGSLLIDDKDNSRIIIGDSHQGLTIAKNSNFAGMPGFEYEDDRYPLIKITGNMMYFLYADTYEAACSYDADKLNMSNLLMFTGAAVHRIGQWNDGSVSTTSSDRSLKHDIELLDDRYDVLFDNLTPRRFKYNDGTSNRYHLGYIAQEVQSALKTSNISESECAVLCTYYRGTDKEFSALRYSEFVSLNAAQIQKAKSRISELESNIKKLEERIAQLEEKGE